MFALYENRENEFELYQKVSKHVPPHLHGAIEMIYVTRGTLEVGIRQDLFHMEKGDFAIVFPEVIHHYQVFCSEKSVATYLLVNPIMSGSYNTILQQKLPKDPVIKKENLHPDIVYAMENLSPTEEGAAADIIHQAFLQIILARALPQLDLMDRSDLQDDDLIYRTVRYIAEHFTENISLTSMAEDLYVSPYTLSRVFSNTFHRNFNRYLNESRLQYACTLLSQTDQTITEICMNTGFESQRTFNRVFQDIYHMSPRDYRKRAENELAN